MTLAQAGLPLSLSGGRPRTTLGSGRELPLLLPWVDVPSGGGWLESHVDAVRLQWPLVFPGKGASPSHPRGPSKRSTPYPIFQPGALNREYVTFASRGDPLGRPYTLNMKQARSPAPASLGDERGPLPDRDSGRETVNTNNLGRACQTQGVDRGHKQGRRRGI